MRKRIGISVIVLLAPVAFAAAQDAGRPQSPARPASPAPATTAQQTDMTLVGCLYREAQIPGRQPNVAERAGVLEDYILADASVAAPQSTTGAKTEGLAGKVPPQGNMFKVENISDERLRALVGKRVEVRGKIDSQGPSQANPAGAPTRDKGPGPDDINLPEVEADSIREVAGTCPATPAARKP